MPATATAARACGFHLIASFLDSPQAFHNLMLRPTAGWELSEAQALHAALKIVGRADLPELVKIDLCQTSGEPLTWIAAGCPSSVLPDGFVHFLRPTNRRLIEGGKVYFHQDRIKQFLKRPPCLRPAGDAHLKLWAYFSEQGGYPLSITVPMVADPEHPAMADGPEVLEPCLLFEALDALSAEQRAQLVRLSLMPEAQGSRLPWPLRTAGLPIWAEGMLPRREVG